MSVTLIAVTLLAGIDTNFLALAQTLAYQAIVD
jgi:hypothetical protein